MIYSKIWQQSTLQSISSASKQNPKSESPLAALDDLSEHHNTGLDEGTSFEDMEVWDSEADSLNNTGVTGEDGEPLLLDSDKPGRLCYVRLG